jgi:hypothetical protein
MKKTIEKKSKHVSKMNTELLQVPRASALRTTTGSSTSMPKSSSLSSFNADSSASTSTDDEDSDERLYGSMMMLVAEPISADATHQHVEEALNFLTSISLTGASDANAPRDASRFVAVSAADFLCNISLTGPMNLPVVRHHAPHHSSRRRSKQQQQPSARRHHNSHHHPSPLSHHHVRVRQVSAATVDSMPSIRVDSIDQLVELIDADAFEPALTVRGAPHPLAQTAFDDTLVVEPPAVLDAVPDVGGATAVATSVATVTATAVSPSSSGRTQRLLADSAPISSPAELVPDEPQAMAMATAEAMAAAYAAATAELENNIDLRKAADALPASSEADEFFRGGSARRVAVPRRLATSLPADPVAGGEPQKLPKRATGTGGGVSLTPAERIARYRAAKVSGAPAAAAAATAVSSSPSSYGSATPAAMASTPVPVAPRPRAALRVMSVARFQEQAKTRAAAPQRIYLCAAANKGVGAPMMLSMCTYLPFVHSRRRVAASGDGVAAVVAPAVGGGADGARKKRATSGGQSFGALLQPSWLRPPPLTCGGEDQAGVPALYSWSYLDDPALATGKHRVVMQLCGMTSTVLPYVRPKVLKAELDTAFARRHAWLSIKLTQLRKVKKLMLHVMSMGDLEPSTLALAYVYLDKLLVRKFCSSKQVLLLAAGAALTLAIKFNESIAMDKSSYRKLMSTLKHVMAVDVREVHAVELRAWVALDLHLFVPSSEPLQHLAAIRVANVDENFIPVDDDTRARKKQARLAALSRPNTIFKVI